MATLGERIRQLRDERNLKQTDLAQALGVNSNTVSKWELGTQDPSPENIAMLVELFDVPIAYLGGSSDDRSFSEIDEELGAATAEEDEQEYLKHMVKLFRDLSPEGQKFSKITLSALWENEKFEREIQGQQDE